VSFGDDVGEILQMRLWGEREVRNNFTDSECALTEFVKIGHEFITLYPEGVEFRYSCGSVHAGVLKDAEPAWPQRAEPRPKTFCGIVGVIVRVAVDKVGAVDPGRVDLVKIPLHGIGKHTGRIADLSADDLRVQPFPKPLLLVAATRAMADAEVDVPQMHGEIVCEKINIFPLSPPAVQLFLVTPLLDIAISRIIELALIIGEFAKFHTEWTSSSDLRPRNRVLPKSSRGLPCVGMAAKGIQQEELVMI
jgi:hypothetical protein